MLHLIPPLSPLISHHFYHHYQKEKKNREWIEFRSFSKCLHHLHLLLHLFCVPSARKESRYREPPPTPPGYTALTISDLAEGQHPAPSVPTSTVTHTGRRPPDYTTALQRSRMVTQSPDSHQAHQGAKQRAGGLHRTRSPAEEQEAEEEEEGESMSSKLIALRKPKPVAQHTPETPRP